MNALALFLPVAMRRDTIITLVLPDSRAVARSPRRRLVCQWRKDSETGGLVCLWRPEGSGESADATVDGSRLAA